MRNSIWIAVKELCVPLVIPMKNKTMVSARLDPTVLHCSAYKYNLPWVHQVEEELIKMYIESFKPLLLSLAENIWIHMNLDGETENKICPWEVFPTVSYGSHHSIYIHRYVSLQWPFITPLEISFIFPFEQFFHLRHLSDFS